MQEQKGTKEIASCGQAGKGRVDIDERDLSSTTTTGQKGILGNGHCLQDNYPEISKREPLPSYVT